MRIYIHKDISGIECMSFQTWVEKFGSDADIKTHNDPNPKNKDKRILLDRYYKENNIHSIEEYEDGNLVQTTLIQDLPDISKLENEEENILRFVYLNINGEECMPLDKWVKLYGTKEDKIVHDDPYGSAEKAALLTRYMKAVEAHSMQMYEYNELIQDYLISDIIADSENTPLFEKYEKL